jgi:hypothetical protein
MAALARKGHFARSLATFTWVAQGLLLRLGIVFRFGRNSSHEKSLIKYWLIIFYEARRRGWDSNLLMQTRTCSWFQQNPIFRSLKSPGTYPGSADRGSSGCFGEARFSSNTDSGFRDDTICMYPILKSKTLIHIHLTEISTI